MKHLIEFLLIAAGILYLSSQIGCGDNDIVSPGMRQNKADTHVPNRYALYIDVWKNNQVTNFGCASVHIESKEGFIHMYQISGCGGTIVMSETDSVIINAY